MYRIVLAPAAVRQFNRVPGSARKLLKRTMRERLSRENPTREDRNRCRLRRRSFPADLELRVDPWRVFYRVQRHVVTIELIGRKQGARLLIERKGVPL